MHWIRLAVLLGSICQASTALADRPIELVLVLDTTGSMSGLIDRAKSELWEIVDRLAAAEPERRIRLGLVAFRDRGDSYVTRVHDLTDDIDASYGQLLELTAGGGGDAPESVNRALDDALNRVRWSASRDVERAIILAGDAPPHMDYVDEVQWPAIVRDARTRGIAIHAIACGASETTRRTWQRIAEAGAGRFARLSATPAAATASPWDAQLAALNRALTETVVPYGDEARREQLRTAAERAGSAGARAAAARASYLGRRGVATTLGEADLVSTLGAGALDWDGLDAASPPADLRGLPRERLREQLEDHLDRRNGLLSEVAYYAQKRDDFVETHRAEADNFSREVVDALIGTARPPGG